jgi:hypothetical protein
LVTEAAKRLGGLGPQKLDQDPTDRIVIEVGSAAISPKQDRTMAIRIEFLKGIQRLRINYHCEDEGQ